jgi:hypothetical protein
MSINRVSARGGGLGEEPMKKSGSGAQKSVGKEKMPSGWGFVVWPGLVAAPPSHPRTAPVSERVRVDFVLFCFAYPERKTLEAGDSGVLLRAHGKAIHQSTVTSTFLSCH